MRTRRTIRPALCLALVWVITGTTWAAADRPGVTIDVVSADPAHVVLDYDFGPYRIEKVDIDGRTFQRIRLGKEPQILRAGAPDLPRVCRSVIIDDQAAVEVNILGATYYEVSDVDVAPSKGCLSRTVDPADVPFVFDPAVYERDEFYPGPLATLSTPYIMRDVRGVTVRVNPFQYNPVTRVLRVYTSIRLEVVSTGDQGLNTLPVRLRDHSPGRAFHQLFKHHFLNYASDLRYPPLDEDGEMLIICYDAWIPNIQPFADYKESIGIPTTVVGISTIGNSSAAIKNYVLNTYNSSDLAYVLLVGDVQQVATTIIDGITPSDSAYALLAGNDSYPEVIVGRFSAQTAAEVDTQVERSINYESAPATQQSWFWRGTGIGSAEGDGYGDEGQADYVHIDEIRGWLLGFGYTDVDQIYDPGASAAQVTAAINAGRGIVNYCGHGSEYSWSTTGFSNADVNALTNAGMLPFIVSVACVNGDLTVSTCFAEAWLRATDTSGNPTGAVGMYASSVNCSWAPPMEMQDEFNLLYTDINEPYHSFGALCYAGSCASIDAYGSSGEEIYDEYVLFGDPSLCVVGTVQPPTGLGVSGGDLDAYGPPGGPFTPDSTTYTLTNYDSTPLDYAVSADVDWVSISNATGTLAAGATVDVVVSLNSAANVLGHGVHTGTLQFTNVTNGEGNTQRAVSVEVDAKAVQYSFPFDSDPGWATEGDWEFGQPLGGGSHDGDPFGGHTGNYVYGYNLAGDYPNNMSAMTLTTPALDCSDLTDVELRFWRWLGVEMARYDHARVEVSNDGVNWVEVWANPTDESLSDTNWEQMIIDISAVADEQATVYIRWIMGATDSSVTYPGWNIDDVEIWGVPTGILGDLDGDGDVDLQDLSILLANYGMTNGAQYEDGDLDGDGDVDLSDLSLLLANYGH